MNKDRIRISIVNYTNTVPFKWALKRNGLLNGIDLQEDIPSVCAQKLKSGQVDLALVPVALLTELENYFIEGNFCIGANGPVDSVKLYGRVPLEKMERVMLDYQSKSSIALARVLFKFFWKKAPHFDAATPGFENNIAGNTGAVVIGDRTFALNGQFEYEYDLAAEWKKFTGLPFVFAAWVRTRRLPDTFCKAFNTALKHGVENIATAVNEEYIAVNYTNEQAREYLEKCIDYKLDEKKKEALELFLDYIRML